MTANKEISMYYFVKSLQDRHPRQALLKSVHSDVSTVKMFILEDALKGE